ncbi:MAG: hypothetical protein U1F76_00745 [Candidatus Competibacteraceae bacterium]
MKQSEMQRKRVLQHIEQLQKRWELLDKKLHELEMNRIMETHPDERFRLEQIIKGLCIEHDQVEKQLSKLESKVDAEERETIINWRQQQYSKRKSEVKSSTDQSKNKLEKEGLLNIKLLLRNYWPILTFMIAIVLASIIISQITTKPNTDITNTRSASSSIITVKAVVGTIMHPVEVYGPGFLGVTPLNLRGNSGNRITITLNKGYFSRKLTLKFPEQDVECVYQMDPTLATQKTYKDDISCPEAIAVRYLPAN